MYVLDETRCKRWLLTFQSLLQSGVGSMGKTTGCGVNRPWAEVSPVPTTGLL